MCGVQGGAWEAVCSGQMANFLCTFSAQEVPGQRGEMFWEEERVGLRNLELPEPGGFSNRADISLLVWRLCAQSGQGWGAELAGPQHFGVCGLVWGCSRRRLGWHIPGIPGQGPRDGES